jgi:DNA-binding MarR family transcriptional regulator
MPTRLSMLSLCRAPGLIWRYCCSAAFALWLMPPASSWPSAGTRGSGLSTNFAIRSIDAGAELRRQLGVSKQAAAKTIAFLEERGYVLGQDDPRDSRRRQFTVTPEGHALLAAGEQIFDELRDRWARRIGTQELERLEEALADLGIRTPSRFDAPGCILCRRRRGRLANQRLPNIRAGRLVIINQSAYLLQRTTPLACEQQSRGGAQASLCWDGPAQAGTIGFGRSDSAATSSQYTQG